MTTQSETKNIEPIPYPPDTALVDGSVKSPLNYIGGKYKILNQILPLFPGQIDNFVDLFAGGCNVGINAKANRVYFNDNLIFLIEMFEKFKSNDIDTTLGHVNKRIEQFKLSLTNEDGYKEFRKFYNKEKNPLDLFVLIAYSFNHQIRFNNNHEFNNPFGRERSSFNKTMKQNLELFISKLKEKEVFFSSVCFDDFNFSFLSEDDFVYCDPPYLITTGTYNDGKRGFKGWTIKEEMALLEKLDDLDKQGIRFALSNVLEHKGKSNDILKKWVETKKHYRVSYLDFDYSNSNYQTLVRNKSASVEVLITNYIPEDMKKFRGVFDEFSMKSL